MKTDKTSSLIIVTACYLIALGVAALVWIYTSEFNSFYRIFFADVAGTVVIFIGSVITRNSSMYDPYWSVVPPLIVIALIIENPEGNTERQGMILTAVLIWSIRLTINWIKGWKGLDHEDWRYKIIAEKTGKLYWPASFFGIHLLPTLWVYAGCLPLFYAIPYSSVLNPWDYVAFIVCTAGAFIELMADEQLRDFKTFSSSNEFIDSGIWKISRHPNYFGELLFWTGIFISVIPLPGFEGMWTISGLISLIFLFKFISIPMMEKRNIERKPGYTNYIKKVSSLVPFIRI
ncbi:DUF1295 domain-containing protein [Mangrovivirga cuniculi]|uniref:Uncharacterized protein n=1 Tax=Mangrovivirga cuniculi TaxID=2715131 RepID=A0A4D7JST8_9BACT|nr:DUF1295 domain-containing protein [Mangrovivirga cuniculi]QCK14005.1 hypothetical protein DCC35_04180 [Mangrovivirga cuniculi]